MRQAMNTRPGFLVLLSCCLCAGLVAVDAHALTNEEQQTWPPRSASPPTQDKNTPRDGEIKVGLINLTDIDLCVLQLSPAGSGKWTEDLLNGDMLKDGGTIKVTFPWGARAIWWDMRLFPKSGGECVEWKDIPIKRFRQLILMVENGKPVLRGE